MESAGEYCVGAYLIQITARKRVLIINDAQTEEQLWRCRVADKDRFRVIITKMALNPLTINTQLCYVLGLAQSTLTGWMKCLIQDGEDALRRRKRGRPEKYMY